MIIDRSIFSQLLQIYRVHINSHPCSLAAKRADHGSESESHRVETAALDEPASSFADRRRPEHGGMRSYGLKENIACVVGFICLDRYE